MREELPIACSLPAADKADREQAWGQVIAAWATTAVDVPGGLRVSFRAAAGLRERLQELAALEGECCPWMALEVSRPPELALTIAAPAEALPALRRLFAARSA